MVSRTRSGNWAKRKAVKRVKRIMTRGITTVTIPTDSHETDEDVDRKIHESSNLIVAWKVSSEDGYEGSQAYDRECRHSFR